MLTITITTTMLTFSNLTDEQANTFSKDFELKWSAKGYYYVKDTPEKLYQLLLKLSYDYDIELT